ncbi:MAG: winged helix-turn-helix transcriptional regulator [Bacilli bacterium]|nr:winged helix-turn-helix transcriptional regulator [Bacilli bacterium]
MEKNVLEELKSLDIAIMKKIFHMAQNLNIEYRITPIQMTIIKFIMDKNNQICYQKDLCHFTGRGKSTVSSVLTTMEKNGLIIRNVNDDNKLTSLTLTNKGISIFRKMQNNLDDFSNKITDGLSSNDLNVFFEVIYTLKKNINKKGD